MNQLIKFSREDFFFLSTLFITLLGLVFYLLKIESVLAISILVINILFLFKFLNKIPVFILFFYILLHSKIFFFFYILDFSISYWPSFQNTSEIGPVMVSYSLFLVVLGNLVSGGKIGQKFYVYKISKPSNLLFWVISILLVFILFFGIVGDNIFISGGYNNITEYAQKSTLHEYFILLFLFLTIYSPPYLYNKLIISLFFILYNIKTLLYGGRIEVVQISLLVFYYFYAFKSKIKTIYIVTFLVFGFYIIGVVSNIRAHPQIFLSEDYISIFNPSEIFQIDTNIPYLSSTEGDVVQSSARMVGLINNNQLSSLDRFLSFLNFIISPIIPSSYLSNLSNLATYKQDLYQSGGGGLICTFFYCWLGYLGPIVIAIFIGFILNKFFNVYSQGYYIYGLCLLVTFPRWFSYNPIFLIKFSLYALIFFYLTRIFTFTKQKLI